MKLKGDMKSPIIYLYAPGWKNLLGEINREFRKKICRVSLGGLRDETEIRGHRKTYWSSGELLSQLKTLHQAVCVR